MKVLVAGGTAFVGARVVAGLLEDGHATGRRHGSLLVVGGCLTVVGVTGATWR